jgi:hypothetical protein
MIAAGMRPIEEVEQERREDDEGPSRISGRSEVGLPRRHGTCRVGVRRIPMFETIVTIMSFSSWIMLSTPTMPELKLEPTRAIKCVDGHDPNYPTYACPETPTTDPVASDFGKK